MGKDGSFYPRIQEARQALQSKHKLKTAGTTDCVPGMEKGDWTKTLAENVLQS